MDLTQIVLKAKRTYSDASKNEKNLIFSKLNVISYWKI